MVDFLRNRKRIAGGAGVSGLSVRQATTWDHLQYNTYYNVDGWLVGRIERKKVFFGFIHSSKRSYFTVPAAPDCLAGTRQAIAFATMKCNQHGDHQVRRTSLSLTRIVL